MFRLMLFQNLLNMLNIYIFTYNITNTNLRQNYLTKSQFYKNICLKPQTIQIFNDFYSFRYKINLSYWVSSNDLIKSIMTYNDPGVSKLRPASEFQSQNMRLVRCFLAKIILFKTLRIDVFRFFKT